MAMIDDSTTSNRPDKPYDGFPLFPHASGRWAKKIRGKFHYFGPWQDWQGALARYMADKDDLEAGRKPKRVSGDTRLTVAEMVAAFLNARNLDVEIRATSWFASGRPLG